MNNDGVTPSGVPLLPIRGPRVPRVYEEPSIGAFEAGYHAALRDLNGSFSDLRGPIILADIGAAAARAKRAAGKDWLRPIVEEQAERDAAQLRRQPTPPARVGIVYVLRDAALGRVKIGWTGNSVDSRKRSIENASGLSLTVIATARGTTALERHLHEAMRDHRLNGEWFSEDPALDVILDEVGARRFG